MVLKWISEHMVYNERVSHFKDRMNTRLLLGRCSDFMSLKRGDAIIEALLPSKRKSFVVNMRKFSCSVQIPYVQYTQCTLHSVRLWYALVKNIINNGNTNFNNATIDSVIHYILVFMSNGFPSMSEKIKDFIIDIWETIVTMLLNISWLKRRDNNKTIENITVNYFEETWAYSFEEILNSIIMT